MDLEYIIKDRLGIRKDARLKDPRVIMGLLSKMEQHGYEFNWVVNSNETWFEISRGDVRKTAFNTNWEKYYEPVLDCIYRITDNEDF